MIVLRMPGAFISGRVKHLTEAPTPEHSHVGTEEEQEKPQTADAGPRYSYVQKHFRVRHDVTHVKTNHSTSSCKILKRLILHLRES